MKQQDFVDAIALLEKVANLMHSGLDMTKADHHILAVRLIEVAAKMRELVESNRIWGEHVFRRFNEETRRGN